MRTLGLILVIVVAGVRYQDHRGPRPDQNRQCTEVDDKLRTPDSARVPAGTYSLTVVATGGTRAGHRASGRLQLRPTSAADRSPKWPAERPPEGDTIGTPLYGATDVDFAAVGAPVERLNPTAYGGSDDAPPTGSTDPLHPGVLALIQNAKGQGLRQTGLVIGTLANRRVADGVLSLDGAGIILWVRRFTASGFDGRWWNFGIVANGAGYFCAVREVQ